MEVRRSGDVPVLPHSVTLTGPLRALCFPAACAHCGAPATERLPVTRAFSRDWRYVRGSYSADDFRFISVQTLSVPFCGGCIVRHRQEEHPIGIVGSLLSVLTTVYVIPLAVAVLGVALYVAPDLIGPAAALVRGPQTAAQASVFALLAAAFAVVVWHQTRRRRASPATTVTRAFDFSDNRASLFREEVRVYGMANERFAREFEDANSTRRISQ